MKSAILCVGSELVLGEIVNTNSAWLAIHLAEIGLETIRHETVGDDEPRLIDSLLHSVSDADVVIITGGIGPTPDDITRQALAKAAGVPLVRDSGALAHIEHLFAGWGRKMSPSNAIQADFPEGSTIIPNPRGTAAGFRMPLGRSEVFVLPGVPSEMKAMWEESVRNILLGKGNGGAVVTGTVNCFGRGEADITDQIKDLMAPGRNPSVGDTAEDAVIKVRIRATADTRDAAMKMIEATKADVKRRLGDCVFGEDDDTLHSMVLRMLIERKATVATAESCTGGLIAKLFTDISGSSAAFIQGVVAYHNEAKVRLLGVPRELIEKHGAVSEQVARAMAEGARAAASTDYAISVTGIAGPTGGTPEKPVGLVYIAAASARGVESREIRLRGTREQIRDRAAKQALNLLRMVLISS